MPVPVDVLGEVIATVRAGDADTRFVRASGAWGVCYPGFAGSGFRIVLSGDAWLVTAAGPPRPLQPGDVVLVPFGARHGFSHAPVRLDHLPQDTLQDTLQDT